MSHTKKEYSKDYFAQKQRERRVIMKQQGIVSGNIPIDNDKVQLVKEFAKTLQPKKEKLKDKSPNEQKTYFAQKQRERRERLKAEGKTFVNFTLPVEQVELLKQYIESLKTQ